MANWIIKGPLLGSMFLIAHQSRVEGLLFCLLEKVKLASSVEDLILSDMNPFHILKLPTFKIRAMLNSTVVRL
jgi:hypothetical protein